MNKVILMGRLTRDPEVRYSAGENALILSAVFLSDVQQNLRKSISDRD